jgi:hypothetical protein
MHRFYTNYEFQLFVVLTVLPDMLFRGLFIAGNRKQLFGNLDGMLNSYVLLIVRRNPSILHPHPLFRGNGNPPPAQVVMGDEMMITANYIS